MQPIERLISLFSAPENEWEKINNENIVYKKLYVYIILPLLILGVLAILTGNYFVKFAFIESFIYLLSISVIIWVTSYVIRLTSDYFDSKKDFNASFTLVSYSFIPLLIANIPAKLALFFFWMSFLGLFGIYLFWKGLKPVLNTPQSKQIPQISLVIILVFVMMILFNYFSMLVKNMF